MVLPTERKTGEPWTNNRRREPAAWQIAGVWISAAALLIAAARAAIDLWLLLR